MNPLIQSVQNPAMQSLKRMYHTFQTAQNPQAVMASLAQQNPMVSQVMRMSGGNLKDTFYRMCQEKGVNPDDILNQLR